MQMPATHIAGICISAHLLFAAFSPILTCRKGQVEILFSYDSKLMQTLTFVGDLIILNLLYLLCCVPVFTIGAAQAALYSGVRTLLDKTDDSSCAAAFFRSFRTGFGAITLAWLIFAVLMALAGWSLVLVLVYKYAVSGVPLWLCVASVCVCALFQAQLSLFHARFSCTVWQLIRNSFLMCALHPLRAVLCAAFVWLPVGVALTDLTVFLRLVPLWLCGYFSLALLLNFLLMKKPFQKLIDQYRRTHPDESSETEPSDEPA